MKVTMDEQEVKSALLRHVAELFPGTALNAVHFDCSYSSFRGAELTYEAPQTEEQEARIAAVLAQPTTDLNTLVEVLEARQDAQKTSMPKDMPEVTFG